MIESEIGDFKHFIKYDLIKNNSYISNIITLLNVITYPYLNDILKIKNKNYYGLFHNYISDNDDINYKCNFHVSVPPEGIKNIDNDDKKIMNDFINNNIPNYINYLSKENENNFESLRIVNFKEKYIIGLQSNVFRIETDDKFITIGYAIQIIRIDHINKNPKEMIMGGSYLLLWNNCLTSNEINSIKINTGNIFYNGVLKPIFDSLHCLV